MTQVTPIRPQRLFGLDEIKPRLTCNYTVKGWLDRDAVSVLYGESNTGKTFLALDMALHVAAGERWHGSRVRRAPVVYVATEGGGGLGNRLAALKADSPSLTDKAHGRFRILAEAVDLFDGACGLGVRDILNEIGGLIERPGLIVIDTLSRAMGTGDENSAADMARLIRAVDEIRRATGAHIMLVHHVGKDGAKGARGSSALRAAVDTEIALTRSGEVATARATKQRDMASGGAFSYALRPVHLGVDDDGDAVSSAIVEVVKDRGPGALNAPEAPLSDRQSKGLQALDMASKRADRSLTVPTPVGTVNWATVPLWRSHWERLVPDLGNGESSRRTAFHKVKKALESKGLVEIKGDTVRRVQP